MKNKIVFETFKEALDWQKNHFTHLETGIDVIDRIQFPLGEILWVILSENYYLDDYEESVTQYGVDYLGNWYAVYGGHCSCYGWEEMVDGDETKYESLSILLKSNPSANVIIKYRNELQGIFRFLIISE
jgi:hypothetical protein